MAVVSCASGEHQACGERKSQSPSTVRHDPFLSSLLKRIPQGPGTFAIGIRHSSRVKRNFLTREPCVCAETTLAERSQAGLRLDGWGECV